MPEPENTFTDLTPTRPGKEVNLESLVIYNTKGFTVVRPEEILLCKAEGYCTSFYLSGGRRISSSQNLKHYESSLPRNLFMRVHHSFLINLDHVRGYSFKGEIQLSEDLTCPLSASKKKVFLAHFGKNFKQ